MNKTVTAYHQAAAFSSISIIFNPNSTGDGKAMAKSFQAELHRRLPGQDITLVPTRHAGHAEELAYELAKASKRPLIISASGDGGYHEVINGIVRANADGAKAVAGLLPAGNANDHYREEHRGDMISAIIKGRPDVIDLIELNTKVRGKAYTRYAHSYIGFGLTPKVAQELNKVDLHWYNEIWIVLKTFFTLRPIKIVVNGQQHSYYNVICSNVGKMSKVLTISANASNADGKFEVAVFKWHHKLRLLLYLLRASTAELPDARSLREYHFETLRKTLVQLDGEVATIDPSSEVRLRIKPKSLACIV